MSLGIHICLDRVGDLGKQTSMEIFSHYCWIWKRLWMGKRARVRLPGVRCKYSTIQIVPIFDQIVRCAVGCESEHGNGPRCGLDVPPGLRNVSDDQSTPLCIPPRHLSFS